MAHQRNGLLSDDVLTRPDEGATYTCSIAVIGGSTAAYTTALIALKLKLNVCLVQPQRVVGGQFTAQALPASDDGDLLSHRADLVSVDGEKFAISKIQRWFRNQQRRLQPVAGRRVEDPGGSWVGHLSTTPVVASTALNEALMPYLKSGKLRLIPYAEPTGLLWADGETPRRVTGVTCRDRRTRHGFTVRAKIVVEATDLGDLLELGNLPSRVGQEARSDTGEAILPEQARPQCQQSFTFDVLVERTAPGRGVPIGMPKEYGRVTWLNLKEFTGDFWVRKQGAWKKRDFFDAFGIFRYRRLQRRSLTKNKVSVGDVSVINWGTSGHPELGQCCGNDYRTGYLVGLSRPERDRQIQRARTRAQAYIHHLQVNGVSDLKPRGDLTWTKDGIALEPYIREARRGIALTTIRHGDVAKSFFPNQARARTFSDTLGIGQYHYLDLHGNLVEGHVSPKKDDVYALPFTLPASALVPIDTDGMVLSAKSIGTTHITNAAYRMHPMEWAIGEASGFLAAFSVWSKKQPREIVQQPSLLRKLQGFLTRNGIPIVWFDDVAHDDPDFEAIQVMAAAGIITSESKKDLHFRPYGSVSRAVVCTALVNLLGLEKMEAARPAFKDVRPGKHWAYGSIETLKAKGMVAGMGRGRFMPDKAMTRQQLGYLVRRAMPKAYPAAFAETSQDRHIVQRRDLSRVFYVLLKVKLGI
ncbi:FAD-dependent oxidoreductase [Leptothoe kymatousa]|uniref:FAD-dependent oxidoreductase n=1 Tax=Leptothoe kymatousa TAU-MAC 1615 TaxID=2364775 RepID=A0ABS5Y6W2_9CYAN|nr:FAD-dependent oxidoreductase [Leptothoe kymatousa]MBT9313567.1 FAD-dependent oxidoreductase [Leptothoe kymatousa TAU-MAC 1615]